MISTRSRSTGFALATVSAAAGFWFTTSIGRATASRTSAAAPRIELQIVEKSLGDLAADQSPAVDFPVRNLGGQRLVINEADSRCGCAHPDGRTYIVQPGEERFVTMTFDHGAAAGPVRKTNSYTTNDPACPKFELSVTAVVR